jgi:hypothetical protein
MNIRRMMVGLAAVLFTLAGVGLTGRFHSTATRSRPPLPAAMPRPQTETPLHVPYEVMFRRIKFFTDRNIPDSRLSSLLREELGINAEQAERLKQVALRCMDEVAQQDARAQAVIARNRARYPGGLIRRGQEPPERSPELAAMQQERNAMFLRSRSSLQSFFSEEGFKRFDDRVKSKLNSMAPANRPAAKETGRK